VPRFQDIVLIVGLSVLSSTDALPASTVPTNDTLGIYAFHFTGWEGCNPANNPDGSAIVEDAWDSLLEIANAVNGHVDFSGDVSHVLSSSEDIA